MSKPCGHHDDLICGCGVVKSEPGGMWPGLEELLTPAVKPKAHSASYLSPHQMRRLDLACAPVRKAFPSYGPYLVGSVLERADFRDVDVRVILVDKKFDRLFPKVKVHDDAGAHDDVRWTFLCSTVSHWLTDVSGLPVDFQIQRATEANAYEAYKGKFRNPLGVRGWTK